MSINNILAGLTRRRSRGPAPIINPGEHSPAVICNRITLAVVGPDGKEKVRKVREGNIMTVYGLSQIAARLATSASAASAWASAGAIGTQTTAASSTHTGLQASTAIVHLSVGSMAASDLGSRTTRYAMTFASDNPAGAAQINEVGIFGSNNATTRMLARAVLGTASVNKGASDSIQISYDMVANTG